MKDNYLISIWALPDVVKMNVYAKDSHEIA